MGEHNKHHTSYESGHQTIDIRPVRPKTFLQRAGLWLHNLKWQLHFVFVAFYVLYTFITNRVWKIADKSRKYQRPHKKSGKLKVAVVSEFYYPHMGGLCGDVHFACVEFVKKGYDTHLITPRVDGEHNNISESPAGFKISRVGYALPVWSNGALTKICYAWNLGKQIKQLLEREKFDVIHIHCPAVPVLPIMIQRYADCPVVGHLHTLDIRKPLAFKVFHKFFEACFKDFEGLVSVSRTAAIPYEKWFGINMKVIPNGIPIDDYLKDSEKIKKFDDGKINIFFIGRPEPRQGLSIVIAAFNIVHREEPNTRLIIAGDGPLRQFFEDEVPRDIRDSVHFVGTVFEEKPNYFKTADICLVPHQAASLGVVLLESMASEAATVASDIPAFHETYSPNEDVLIAPRDDHEAFAQQVLRLIREPELAKKIGRNAKQKMVDQFSWQKIISDVDEYTLDVLDPRAMEAPRLEAKQQQAV